MAGGIDPSTGPGLRLPRLDLPSLTMSPSQACPSPRSFHVLSAEERRVLDEFDAGTRIPTPFNHRAHVYVTWLYLRRWQCDELSLEAVLQRMQAALRNLAEKHGFPQKYHCTITHAAVCLVAAGMEDDPEADFSVWCDKNAGLLDDFRTVLARHYSDGVLNGDVARTTLVAPDRAPLPCRETA